MHIQFDEAGQPRPHAAHPSVAAGFQCVSSVRVDFQSDATYVFELAHNGQGLVAAALSNTRIKLFNFSEGGLHFAGDLTGHEGMVRQLRFSLPDQPQLLHSCGADGTVRGWDSRAGQQVERYSVPRLELLSCSTNGTLVAAGGGDKILFWDRRTQRPLASWDDTHAQDVTQVAFHPANHATLVSASEDGLIAIFDTAQMDEDEGFLAALNIDTSVAGLGFYGAQGEKLWARSGIESLHLWEWAAACNDEETGGNGALGEAVNAREQLTAAAAACEVGQALAPGLDYLIGCEYNVAAEQLWVLAGTNGGAVGFFPVAEPPRAAITGGEQQQEQQAAAAPPSQQQQQQAAQGLFGQPQAVLAARGAHSDVVRSVLWPGAVGSMCLTGGEDSKVCVWGLQQQAATASAALERQQAAAQPHAQPSGSSDGGSRGQGAVRKHQQPQHLSHQHSHQHSRRAAPY
ncbi:hypothetical protein D9Q98_006316 [Chlorella vulgaris]|uniref:WD40-repeat-containing domain protein n=1 Tax=Chlorella vulgaris TaxID=3077 RepID=A0A9D4TK23_CHLVU|nr:hypothetical protein D9Q98_006316 [Chlorella vulgaris]